MMPEAQSFPLARRQAASLQPGPGRLSGNLRAEHLAAVTAADRLEGAHRERFRSLVGPPGQRLTVGGVGIAPIKPDPIEGTYLPAESGPVALILAARDLPNAIDAQLFDLVAWLPRTGELFRRTGLADLLGPWNVSCPPSDRVDLYEDPASWARSNGAGVVLLDMARAWSALGHICRLTVPSVEFGNRLDRALVPPKVRRPEILVRREVAAA